MNNTTASLANTNELKDFEELLNEYEKSNQVFKENTVVKGVIIEINEKDVAIDIRAKSVGYVSISEFRYNQEVKVGDIVDVFLCKLENKRGELIISHKDAVRYNNWNFLEKCLETKEVIEGKVEGRVKGGYAVDYKGIICFLPGSQVDIVPLKDDTLLIDSVEKFVVLKIDDERGNVVVSRRAILEEKRNKEKDKILETVKVGDILEGSVKNITDYGAFIDFGVFDGLLHLTDISWCRVRHPSDVLSVGQKVKVQITKYDSVNKRISLGMKQLQDNPWESINSRFPVGSITKGKITNIAAYGAFVEIENGIEGLVHVSEISWFRNQSSPGKLFSVNQEVDVMILDIDSKNHRISLGIRQCNKNPWQEFSEQHSIGDKVVGVVKNSTDFGLFIGFDSGVDGLIHISDVDWSEDEEKSLDKKFKRDDKIEVILLGSNYERERISLGIKQLKNPDFKSQIEKLKIGDVVSGHIVNIKKELIELELDIGIKATIKRSELLKNKKDYKSDNYNLNDKIKAKVINFNAITGKLTLSVRELEEDKAKEYAYETNNSGASLGSILGDALQSPEDK